jgi:ABC-type Mn2+/Zn2+ transport system ATPase subunit
MQNYILKSLKLSNSNFLDDLEIEFDCKFTLIQGPNGSGKTSLYMAMRTGEWIYKGQTGQLDLQYHQKSLDAEIRTPSVQLATQQHHVPLDVRPRRRYFDAGP